LDVLFGRLTRELFRKMGVNPEWLRVDTSGANPVVLE
jgi:hypothetical protein